MEPSSVHDLKAFLPAKDHELAKRFYSDLGLTLNWETEQLAEFQIGSFRFLLQNYYVLEFAENFG